MATRPRLLAVMGSGETSPTMVRTHRDLLGRLGPGPVPAVVLDTPFAFQANAGDIAARAVAYFRDSVGHPLGVARLRGAGADPLEQQVALGRLQEAAYVFSGPGSPSYALRQWRGTPVPGLLADKLTVGGCLVFASAAALTVGVATVPVYEIYKVGEEPRWLEGLDLLGALGLTCAVIPHYDNAEGGTHDTRFCYLGEDRLAALEAQLPEEAFVLGVDEHTALVLDLDAGTAAVAGLGGVTVRRRGRSTRLAAGAGVTIAELAARGGVSGPAPAAHPGPAPPAPPGAGGRSPLLEAVAGSEAAFAGALAGRDAAGATRAVLALEAELVAWASDTLQSDQLDRGRAVLRSMVVRLGQLAERGARDPAEQLGPFVDALLELRDAARRQARWDEADAVRRRLAALGVEVRDTPQGTTWRLTS